MARPKKDKYRIRNLCKVIDDYTNNKIKKGEYPILKECCLQNDLCYDYVIELQRETKEKGNDELSRSIKKLLDYKEIIIEKGMITGKFNATACIFILKQPAHAWTDKQGSIDINGNIAGNVSITVGFENGSKD